MCGNKLDWSYDMKTSFPTRWQPRRRRRRVLSPIQFAVRRRMTPRLNNTTWETRKGWGLQEVPADTLGTLDVAQVKHPHQICIVVGVRDTFDENRQSEMRRARPFGLCLLILLLFAFFQEGTWKFFFCVLYVFSVVCSEVFRVRFSDEVSARDVEMFFYYFFKYFQIYT